MNAMDRAVWEAALTYSQFRQLVDDLLRAGKTTGLDQSPTMLEYTRMNVLRMRRLDRRIRLLPEVEDQLSALPFSQRWLVLTEAWCGDAAQVLPVLQKMADHSPRLELRLILRDEHPEIMHAFSTNGIRAIPKILFLDAENGEVAGTWGARPAGAQAIVEAYKRKVEGIADPDQRRAAAEKKGRDLQKWYIRDQTRSVQREVLASAQVFSLTRTKAGGTFKGTKLMSTLPKIDS